MCKSTFSALKVELNGKLEVDATYVLNRLIEIDQMDVLDILMENGEVKPTKIWRTKLSGLDVMEITSDDIPSLLKKLNGLTRSRTWNY